MNLYIHLEDCFMDEIQLALEATKLSIKLKNTELVSDLLKIGIPSLVAIAGLVSTYFLNKQNNMKDLQITKLKIDSGSEKEIVILKRNLVEKISLHVSRVYSSFSNYGISFGAKLELIQQQKDFTQILENQLQKDYLDCGILLDNNHEAESYLHLLGDKTSLEKYTNFRNILLRIGSDYPPNKTNITRVEVLKTVAELATASKEFYKSLSSVYFK